MSSLKTHVIYGLRAALISWLITFYALAILAIFIFFCHIADLKNAKVLLTFLVFIGLGTGLASSIFFMIFAGWSCKMPNKEFRAALNTLKPIRMIRFLIKELRLAS